MKNSNNKMQKQSFHNGGSVSKGSMQLYEHIHKLGPEATLYLNWLHYSHCYNDSTISPISPAAAQEILSIVTNVRPTRSGETLMSLHNHKPCDNVDNRWQQNWKHKDDYGSISPH